MRKRFSLFVVLMLTMVALCTLLMTTGSENLATITTAVAAATTRTTDAEMSEVPRDVLINQKRAQTAPPLAEGTWINSTPLNLEALRGRVVVVDFWTYNCYNCRNTLPSLKRLDSRYQAKGLTIIGVHSPEGDSAKNVDRVRNQVRELGIRYPVVTDNNYDTWRAYGIEAWPTILILDKQGRVRYKHIGESMYAEQEAVIQKLLAE